MRVMHVLAEMSRGGAERVVLELVVGAVSDRDEVAVAAAPGPWAAAVEEAGARFVRLPPQRRGAAATLAAVPALATAIRSFRPAVVHAHNVRATLAAGLALTPARHPARLLTTVHGLDDRDYRPARRLLELTGARVIACAPGVRDALVAAGMRPEQVTTIVNGAALPAAPAWRRAAVARQLGLDDRPLVVGMGRLEEVKNWPLFMDSVAAVPGIQAVVAGLGPLRRELERRADLTASPVRFVGPVDDVAALLGCARCVVSTSDREGLSMALLEAMSLGVPVVATAVAGLDTLLPPGAAELVSPGDRAGIAAAVRRIVADPGHASRLGAGARRAARAWTPQAMAAAYRDCYHQLVSGPIRG